MSYEKRLNSVSTKTGQVRNITRAFSGHDITIWDILGGSPERCVTLGTGVLLLPHPNKSTPQISRKHEQHNEDRVST